MDVSEWLDGKIAGEKFTLAFKPMWRMIGSQKQRASVAPSNGPSST